MRKDKMAISVVFRLKKEKRGSRDQNSVRRQKNIRQASVKREGLRPTMDNSFR
jgi:hypothetical protein